MADYIKEQENKFIEKQRKDIVDSGGKLLHETEMAMRLAFSYAATMFLVLGRHEGDESRKRKIIDALGLMEEELES